MKYQKKYSTASDYLSDTHETNSVSMVSTDTLYYDGTAILTNTSSGGNIIVEEDGLYLIKDGNIYPVSHPDLSTQPSLLSYRVGLLPIYEVLIPKSEILQDGGDMRFKLPENFSYVLELWSVFDSKVIAMDGSMSILSDGYIETSPTYYSSDLKYIYMKYVGVLPENYYSSNYSGNTYLFTTTYNSLSTSEQLFPFSAPEANIYNLVDTIVGKIVVHAEGSNYTQVNIMCYNVSNILTWRANLSGAYIDIKLSRASVMDSRISASVSIPYQVEVYIYNL